MLRLKKDKFTADEYLAMERVADYKSEYYGGEIFALAGGTVDHNAVTVNCAAELRQLLEDWGI
ncbi:MAG: Uma2 family endonuclease [Anaerolineae bacterium]|nr:Uma2 family endonuclease [Anaerolineae bacterium]